MKKQSKKIITMLLVFMFAFAVPSTMVMAVPKKSGIDSSMSTKLTKAYNTYGYTYKGKKASYLNGLVKQWATGKISKKTLIKKAEALKWKEKSFYPDNNGNYTSMNYRIGSWSIQYGTFTTKCTTASSIKKAGYKANVFGGNPFNCAVTVWNKTSKSYKVYYFGTLFN